MKMKLITNIVIAIVTLGCIIAYTDCTTNVEKVSKGKKFVAALKKPFSRKKKEVIPEKKNEQEKINFILGNDEIMGLELNKDLEEYYQDAKEEFEASSSSSSMIEGAELRVGQRWEEVIQTKSKVLCTRRDRNAYKDRYRTKVFQYNQETNAHFSQDDIFKKYFVVTEREVWDCMKEGDSTLLDSYEDSDVFFIRIVHKLHGTTEIIGKIFYYDGIEVERVPSLWNKDRKSETVSITEVKYIRLSDCKIMRYDGFVELLDPANNIVDEISMHIPIEVFQYDRKLKDTSRTLHRDNVDAKGIHYEKVGSKGDKWSVGSNPAETVGTDKEIAVCTRITDDPRLYSGQFMPKMRKQIVTYVLPDRRKKIYQSLAWYDWIQNFTVTNQELWRCTISQPNEADKVFLRRVTEIVGRDPIAYIVYSQTMDVWKFQLSVNDRSESVKIRDFHYFLPDNNKQVYFYGELELLEPKADENDGNSNDETRPGIEIYSVPVGNDDILPTPKN